MPKLYLHEYRKTLAGQMVHIAAREGVLRDNFQAIIADIKFLDRQGIHTCFFHNVANRFANQKMFRELESKLFNTRIIRIPGESDFHESVLNSQERIFKIIFFERKYLIDERGRRINALTTQRLRQLVDEEKITSYGDLVANANFKNLVQRICKRIENGEVERVHILPAGKNKIKHELFSLEGTGTLIANDYNEIFMPISCPQEINVVTDILKSALRHKYLKARSREYVEAHCPNFFVAKIDGIIVGCVERIDIASETVELGALAVSAKFRENQIGLFLIRSFITEARRRGKKCIISLTRNPKLQQIYKSLDFREAAADEFILRRQASPGTPMFVKSMPPPYAD